MIRLLEKTSEYAGVYPDRIALEDTARHLTYRELETEAGKIRGWLKKQGIGREDAVMILTDRGVGTVVCMLGILKAGAVFVPLESGYPAERVAFIRKDANCALVIDQALYERILREEEPLEGGEEAALHDAAYIIYTSGSTGQPKGILHEYGNLDQEASRFAGWTEREEYRAGLVAPFYFVAAVQVVISSLVRGMTVSILPRDLVKNFKKLTAFIEERKIREIFMPPSYLRLYRHPGPDLRVLQTGGEPANQLYYPEGKPAIKNVYAMSEAGFAVLDMILDRSYDVAPVGRPALASIDVHLIDEDGKRIEGPGTGELCFRNEYVRGYVNLPEKTKAAFVDGVYHTGDILRRDENGVYYLLGRNDDMFKINGNRIEPAEIERRVRELTGLERVYAKGFRETNRAFIVLYYLIDQAEALGIYREGELTADLSPLRRMLPDYMIPAYYVGLEAFPLNVNGKLDRQALRPPDVRSFQTAYAEPENEAERFFCEAMREVLELERVGAEDDFYRIGGDSLSAIRLIERCEEGGYAISLGQLYQGRTPRSLAKTARSAADGDLDREEEEARRRPLPVTGYHRVYLNHYRENPEATYYNLPELFELREEIDVDRLRAALDRVIRAHPALLTKFIREGGDDRLAYDQDLFAPTEIETLSGEAFEARKASLIRPMELCGGRLYRSRIFVTPGKRYLFLDFHHIIADGGSLLLFKNQVSDCYADPECAIPKDHYYAYAARSARYPATEAFREAERFYAARSREAAERGCGRVLKPDLGGPDLGNGLFMKSGFPRGGRSDGLKYLAAMSLTVAEMNGEEGSLLFWVYNGRDEAGKNHSFGLYARTLPVFYLRRPGESGGEILADLEGQLRFGMSHCDYPLGSLFPAEEANAVLFNYQKNTLEQGRLAGLIAGKTELPKDSRQKNGSVICGMIDLDGVPALTWYGAYSKGYYSEEYIGKCCACFEEKCGLFDET